MFLNIFSIFNFFLFITKGQAFNFNECSFIGRILKSNRQCMINPDEYLNVPQIIARHGYHSESHVIVTKDGYLLQIHRIASSKKGLVGGAPIFLQHGLLGSSADWIVNGNNSLGFLLADQGYDVWLGNARGNIYSKGHVSLSVESPAFWNFSFHEMGTRDLPAVFNYIDNISKKPGELIYVGHSMGTTMFFVLSSLLPDAVKTVKLMIALAPVAYMSHVHSPVRYFAPFSKDIDWLTQHLGLNQFLPSNKIIHFLSHECELLSIDKKICENVIFAICGFDTGEFNEEILSLVLSKEPAGTSTKTVVHYAQEIADKGSFQQFDYGTKGNFIKYGSKFPPKYNITNIKTPLYLMYAMNDFLANFTDVEEFADQVDNLLGLYKIKMDSFNHVDFLFGKDAERLVYQPLLKVVQNITDLSNELI